EEFEPLLGWKMILVAIVGDLDAPDQLHHEKRPASLGGTRVKHFSDVRMIHQGQRLPLRLKAGDDVFGIHAQLDDLEGDLAPDRLGLLGHIDHSPAAFTNLLEQLVPANAVTCFLQGRDLQSYRSAGARLLVWGGKGWPI